MAVTAGKVVGPRSNVELSELLSDLPAVGCAVGLDGIEDCDALDGQRAGICHPSEGDRVACCSLDVEDLERDGWLPTLADVELDQGREGGGAGRLAGEEVDAVGVVGEVDVEDVGGEVGVEGAVHEQREPVDQVVHIRVLQAVRHGRVVVTEGSPAADWGERGGEDGADERRGCEEGGKGVHLDGDTAGVDLADLVDLELCWVEGLADVVLPEKNKGTTV